MAQSRNIRIVLASSAGVLQRIVQLLTSLLTLPLVLHLLGESGFGVWGAATSLDWLSGALNLGFGSALVSLIPHCVSAGQSDRGRGYVTASLYGGAALSAVILVGGLALIKIGAMETPAAPFLFAGVALALNIPLSIATEIWFGLQKGYVAIAWQILQTVLTFTLVIVGVLIDASVTFMVAAVYGPMLVANGASLLHVLLRHPFLRPRWRLEREALKTVLTQGGLLFAVSIAAYCAYAFDNVLALAWLGPEASATMAVAMRVCTTASGMVGAVTQPLWPGFADALAANDQKWLRRTMRTGMLVVLGLTLAGCCLLVAFGAPVITWWLHRDLHLGPALLWVMAAWIFATTLTHVPGSLLHASLRLKPQIIVLTIAAVAGFALKYVAARQFGLVGILAVAPALWLGFVAPTYFWLVWRVLRGLAPPLARPA